MERKLLRALQIASRGQKDLKPLSECCVIPNHIEQDIERKCFRRIYLETSNTSDYERVANCYLKVAKLFRKGTFIKSEAKAIYEKYSKLYVKFIGRNPWKEIISKAVDSCDFKSTGNASDDMNNFYNCTNEYLGHHCPLEAVDQSDECDPVEEFYEKCKGINKDCQKWPFKIILPNIAATVLN